MNKINIYYLLLFAAVLVTVIPKAHAQEKDIPKELYVAAAIPDSLKEDANSVIRYNMKEYTVDGPGKAINKVHTIVTILNDKADYEAGISLPYNRKFSSVSSFEMRVYNADGILLKKYHKSDMYDHSVLSNESIVTDDRELSIGYDIASYPTTIEMIYEEDRRSFINLDTWRIQQPEQSVQHEYCRLSISKDAGLRYLNKNTLAKPLKTSDDKIDNYSWEISNLKAVKLEEGAESWRILPKIEFGFNSFEYYGVKGNFDTWQSFGKWLKELNADVCSLSAEREAEIRKMTDTIKNDKAKVEFLYKYMQQNMRYVSVQLGIGGLKPFSATFVDQKKYGDCKALSNYMCALLKAVNITSYCAIINAEANQEPADFAFPHNSFNHEILCVPFKGDTTWLECTSNTQPFGKLGAFTENRNTLIITEDGGKLVNTPKSNALDNQFNSETNLVLDENGGAKATVKILSTGEIRDIFVDHIPLLSFDKQKEFILKDFDIKQPAGFEFKQGKDVAGTKEVSLDLDYDRFCDVKAGDKMFYHPYVLTYWDTTVPVTEKRKTDYYFHCPLQEASSTTIVLPTGFEVETLPVNQSLKFTYGNYDVKYVYDAAKNQVVSTAKFTLTNQVIPAAKYTELQQYLDAVAKAQNKKLVIRRKA